MNKTVLMATLSCAVVLTLDASIAGAGEITIQDRVAAQSAIEKVYWRHRTWPSENSHPKPEFSATLSLEEIRAEVEDSLARARALERNWRRVIGRDEVQAELNRIAAESRDPAMLAELFAALDDDPELIAETLVRPILTDRALRSAFAFDRDIHTEVRRAASHRSGGMWSENEFVEGEGPTADAVSSLEESDEAFFIRSIVGRETTRARVVTVSWPKLRFDDWWQQERARYTGDVAVMPPGMPYVLPSITASTCTNGVWSVISGYVPAPRTEQTAVWTGSEMIVWGGHDQSSNWRRDSGRYTPATDSWRPIAEAGSPSGRDHHTAVWTGSEMIIWGGFGEAGRKLGDGARYNPTTDAWTPVSLVNAPVPRNSHTAVWSGAEMIVWGGGDDCHSTCFNYYDSGGRYRPSTDTWIPTNLTGAPAGRVDHVAVWTGSRMIVWGGRNSIVTGSGGLYDPATDSWTPTSTANVPAGYLRATAVWTGSVMIVWGGSAALPTLTGGRYDPVGDGWTPTSEVDAPEARSGHTAVWTGSQLVIWGGWIKNSVSLNSGGRYAPSTDSWTATSTTEAPEARINHTAIWTGSQMIVWGGSNSSGTEKFTGGRYNPGTDTWTSTAINAPAPTKRTAMSAVWTGAEMIIWGGGTDPVGSDTGGRYNPALDSWTPTPTAGAPSARLGPTAVWSGDRMLVWGGTSNDVSTNTGAAYRPSTNSWLTMSTTNAPEARNGHTAVWDGTRMIVFGGFRDTGPVNHLNTGGRYNPTTDSWTATAPAPEVTRGHTAIWDGQRMLVWGGKRQSLNSPYEESIIHAGYRYDPVGDAWAPMPPQGFSVSCFDHRAVWSGTEMLVWGPDDTYNNPLGARFRPATNAYTPMNMTGSPTARVHESAVWTGSAMAIWSGSYPIYKDDGALYSPSTDSWSPIGRAGQAPGKRAFHTAVWSGTEMIVWGGRGDAGTGARYCFCAFTDKASGLAASKVPGATRWTWTLLANANAYDVTRGNLGPLRSSGGDYSIATGTCLASHITTPPVDDPQSPAAGAAFWYLVRGIGCGPGSYDEGSTSQSGSRDAEIQASGVGCP